jgi:mono/diheme cytochrome c family protein
MGIADFTQGTVVDKVSFAMINSIPRLIALTLACGFVAAVASAQDAALVQRGQKVFTDQKCTICHSIAGVGNKKGPLDTVGSTHLADEIRGWITNAPEMAAKAKADRKPAMKAFANLDKADVDALVAYLATLKKK